MENTKFQLVDYTHDVLKIADANRCTVEQALQYFVMNLATMREYYEGAPYLNYHELGHKWNCLLSDEKVAQQNEAQSRLTRYSKGGKNL